MVPRTLVLVLVCPLAGCASWSSPTIQAASVDDKQYLGMACERLKVEKGRVGRQPQYTKSHNARQSFLS